MKATSAFKLSKPVKRMLATMNKQDRDIYKSLAITAQLIDEEHQKRKLRGKEKDSEE
jgi:hypothetical protein